MADTVSWTEPLDSASGQLCLGIECDRGCGAVRGVECIDGAGGVPMRGWRCAHYGRGVNGGQRVRLR